MKTPTPRLDIALALFLIAVCAIVLFESRKIPPGSFEPLGSAPVPQAVAALIIALCCLVIIRAWRQLQHRDETGESDEDLLVLRRLDTVFIAVFTVLYVGLLQSRLVDFALITSIYLIVSIGLLVRFQWRQLPVLIVISLLMAYGCEYLFTQVFVVDLPGVF